MAGKKGRNNLPLEPLGADPLRLYLASPQNNPHRIQFSAPRERIQECLQRSEPKPCIMGGSFVGKNLPLECPQNRSLKMAFLSHLPNGVYQGRSNGA